MSLFHWHRHSRYHGFFRLLDALGEIMAKLADLQATQAITNQKVDALAARVALLPQAEDLQPAVDAEVAIQAKLDAIDPAAAAPAPTV